jgi:hypothetical protein
LLNSIVLTCLHSHDDETAPAAQSPRLGLSSSLGVIQYQFSTFGTFPLWFAIQGKSREDLFRERCMLALASGPVAPVCHSSEPITQTRMPLGFHQLVASNHVLLRTCTTTPPGIAHATVSSCQAVSHGKLPRLQARYHTQSIPLSQDSSKSVPSRYPATCVSRGAPEQRIDRPH